MSNGNETCNVFGDLFVKTFYRLKIQHRAHHWQTPSIPNHWLLLIKVRVFLCLDGLAFENVLIEVRKKIDSRACGCQMGILKSIIFRRRALTGR